MSIIARRLISAKNFNGIHKIIAAPVSNISAKLNKFEFVSKVLNQQSVKTINLNYLKSSYSTDDKKGTEINERIKLLLKGNKVVLFIKGTAEQPRCGFSKAVCDILNMHGVSFTTHNILEDEALRSGIKEFSSWPTIPQIFFEGEFVGGCDILLEMHRNGELVEELEKIGIKSKLVETVGKK